MFSVVVTYIEGKKKNRATKKWNCNTISYKTKCCVYISFNTTWSWPLFNLELVTSLWHTQCSNTTQWTNVQSTFLVQFPAIPLICTHKYSIQTRDHCSPVLSGSTCQEIPDGLQSLVPRIFRVSWLDCMVQLSLMGK